MKSISRMTAALLSFHFILPEPVGIHFFNEDTDFQLANESQIIEWLVNIASKEGYTVDEINFVFCSDEYLLEMNQQFLSHDYYTDIITFNNSEKPKELLSDIFISIHRVGENASDLHVSFEHELHRVIAHGLLHLIGFNDKLEDEQILMRKKEDTCISLLNNKLKNH